MLDSQLYIYDLAKKFVFLSEGYDNWLIYFCIKVAIVTQTKTLVAPLDRGKRLPESVL